jgi:hypothetical protein
MSICNTESVASVVGAAVGAGFVVLVEAAVFSVLICDIRSAEGSSSIRRTYLYLHLRLGLRKQRRPEGEKV